MVRIAPSPAASGLISRRLLGMALLTIAPAVTVLAGTAVWPVWRSDAILAASIALLAGSFFTIGVVLLAEAGQGGPGIALMASSVLLLVSWAEEWGAGPLPLLATVLGNYWLLTGGWALYRYPAPRLTRPDRIFFGVMLVWFTVLPVLIVLTSRPEWHEFPAGATWAPWLADRALSGWVDRVNEIGLIVIGAVYIARWALRLRRARPVERRVKTPTAVAAMAAAVAAVAVPVGQALGLSDDAQDVLFTVESAAIVAVPAAFLATVIRQHLARARVTDLVLGINGPPSTSTVVTALRRALQDPDLEVAYWSDERQAYLRGAERPDDDRMATAVESSTGHPLALILTDRALVRDQDLLVAAVSVAGLALEVAHLLETVQSQLRQLQDVSSRVVHAADDERRRLEQDLHDGAQAHLLALGPMIGAAEAATKDPDTARELTGIRLELKVALRQLREFARGMHPVSLQSGLTTAVQDVCRPHSFSTVVDLPDATLPPGTAHAAYLVICESVANVAKHAQAHKVQVAGTLRDGFLELEVTDDGRGGAVPGQGRGLRNIQDRIVALGGDVKLLSPPGAGTRITMRIPCA